MIFAVEYWDLESCLVQAVLFQFSQCSHQLGGVYKVSRQTDKLELNGLHGVLQDPCCYIAMSFAAC